MTTVALSLNQITLAAEDVPTMVRFYDAFFGAALEPFDAYGATLYRGTLHGVRLLICPNTIAEVEAKQNRHQFSYRTPDLAAAVQAAEKAGGQLKEQGDTFATILDPDGNTIVLEQAG